MTEEEAKTKWCPFVRAANKNNEADVSIGGMNRWRGDELLPKGTKCIGAMCMAWRWAGADIDKSDCFVAERTVETWTRAGWIVTEERDERGYIKLLHPSVGQGYCGLAGRP